MSSKKLIIVTPFLSIVNAYMLQHNLKWTDVSWVNRYEKIRGFQGNKMVILDTISGMDYLLNYAKQHNIEE